MYFPFLRARQFELIALRELVKEGGILKDSIMPVLEPVRKGLNNLDLVNKVFVDNQFNAFIVVNPMTGDITGDTDYFLDYYSSIQNSTGLIPAFHFANNSNYIKESLHKYSLSGCLLIYANDFSDETAFKEMSCDKRITHVMIKDASRFRSLDRYFKSSNKIYIKLDDLFEKQKRNEDYLGISAHKFSEEHLYYKAERYDGFSDYTVLPSEFTDGGSVPRAVVIHISYLNKNDDNSIWIRHFTSETNGMISNVQGKFAEAVQKAVNFLDSHNIDNIAISELKQNFSERKYPGLGIVKKISIKNHLIVVNSFLNNQ